MKNGTRSNQLLKALLVLGALALFAASCIKQAERLQPSVTSTDTPDPVPARVTSTTFKDFSHKIPEHLEFECNTCHRREERGIKSQLGGHESCIGCHMNEWIDEEQLICAICHTDLNSKDPPVKAFPVKFKEGFNTVFDHADHDNGAGRPSEGCATCHEPSGRGKTIPSGFETHATCYVCHKPENTNMPEGKNDSCNVCHKIAPYIRTLPSQYSPKIIFSHRDHTRDSCNECHRINPGAPQGQQVSSIDYLEHRTNPRGFNCLQCHNGTRAFTGNNPANLASCSRCHTEMLVTLPSGTYSDTAAEAPAED
ncbi:MAG: cytochrome c3 family protein [Pyrinomonadaceae bacterium]